MINKQLINAVFGSVIRHGLTVASGFLFAKAGVGLNADTITNLNDLSVAVLTLLAGLGWSLVEKKLRPAAK